MEDRHIILFEGSESNATVLMFGAAELLGYPCALFELKLPAYLIVRSTAKCYSGNVGGIVSGRGTLSRHLFLQPHRPIDHVAT